MSYQVIEFPVCITTKFNKSTMLCNCYNVPIYFHLMLLTIDHPCMSLCSCHFREGHLEIVRHLVSTCGANVNIKKNDGRTPLHLACL